MTHPLTAIQTLPPGINEVGDLIADLDEIFLTGFARCGAEQSITLERLAGVFAGTPLGASMASCVEALSRAEFVEGHFTTLAAARTALQGARYDALSAQLAEALGRSPISAAPITTEDAEGPIAVWFDSARQWLMEIALGGFRELDAATLLPFAATLEQLQQEPRTVRLAALLSGYLGELLDALPVSSMASVPVYRWVDLWSRAMIAASALPARAEAREVSGTLRLLGVELRHHPNFVSLLAHGVLDADGELRLVRTTLSRYKVDVVVGPQVWDLFGDQAKTLLEAASSFKALKLTSMPLLESGDLIWNGAAAKLGVAFDPLELAAEHYSPAAGGPAVPAIAPLDRHPAQIGEPIFLEDFKVEATDDLVELELGDALRIIVASHRMSPAGDLSIKDISGAKALFGMLRFDGGAWQIQPLVVKKGKKLSHTAASATAKRKSDTMAILNERAGRLLRGKS